MTTASVLRVFAPAKINLFLHVGEKREDGYHALQSLVAFADVGDALSFSPADDLTLSIEGPFAAALALDGDNLVLKAARALAQWANIRTGARIVLTKNLPVASGIGGGSADAAAALRGLAQLWRLEMSDDERLTIAAGIGSDVPVCVSGVPSWMEGRGECLTPFEEMPEIAILLVNPGVAVSTAAVFRALRARRGIGLEKPAISDAAELLRFLASTANDLEAPACEVQPIVANTLRALETLPGVLLSRMSGSGATCFAIFESGNAAARAAEIFATRQPNWWVRATRTVSKKAGTVQ